MEIYNYNFEFLIDRFKNIHSKHYWPLCPECKKFIPYFNIWEKNNKQYLDIKCHYCKEKKKLNYFQLKTIKLEDYLKVISDEKNIEYNSILKEKINEKVNDKNKSLMNKIGFCMDFHGWLDLNHYKVHEKMKFKTKHIICEKEIYLYSYCKLCNHKIAKFFCENCEIGLCKSCMKNHENKCKSNIKNLSTLQSLFQDKIDNYLKFLELKKKKKINLYPIIDFFFLYYQIYLTTTDQHLNDYWITMTLLNLPFEKFKESNDFSNTILNKNACSINYEFRDIFIKEKNSKITQIIDKGDGITFFISLFKEISRSSMIIGKYYNDLLETTTIPIINVISFIKINEYLITLSSNCKNIYNINKKIASKNIKNEDNIKLIINYIGNKFIGVSQTDIFIYEFIPKNNDDEPEINMLKKITLEGQEDLMRSQMNDINYQNMKNNIEKSSKSPKRKNSNENILKNKYDFDIMPEVYITAIKFIEDPYLLKSKNESYMSALFIGNNKGNVKIYKKSKDDNFYYHDSINFKDGEITNIFELREKIIITTSSINDCNMFIYDKKENLIKDKADKHIFSDEGISFIQSLTNTILITGSSKGLISIWDINTLSLLNRFKNNDIKDNMTSLCVLKKTQIIISSYSKGQIVIWSVADEENLPIEN